MKKSVLNKLENIVNGYEHKAPKTGETIVVEPLPKITEIRKVSITGNEYLESEHGKKNPVDEDGNEIAGDKRYLVNRAFDVDHLKRLKDAYRSGGDLKVANYIKFVNETAAKQRAEMDAKRKAFEQAELSGGDIYAEAAAGVV